MNDIVVLHRSEEWSKALLLDFSRSLSDAKDQYRLIFYGSKGLVMMDESGDEPVDVEPDDLKALLVMRHGSDSIFKDLASSLSANKKVVFGGAGWNYPDRLPEEIPILRPVTLRPKIGLLNTQEIKTLVSFAQTGVLSDPGFLYDEKQEKVFADRWDNSHAFKMQCIEVEPASFTTWPAKQAGRAVLVWNNDAVFPQLKFDAALVTANRSYGDFYDQDQHRKDIYAHENFDPEILIICAELTPDPKKIPYQALAGLELVRDLRLSGKLRCPVLICSVLSEEELRKRDRFNLLALPGHYFVQIKPGQPEQVMISVKALTETSLKDVLYYHLDAPGKLDEIFHNLKSKLRRAAPLQESISKAFADAEVAFPELYRSGKADVFKIKNDFYKQAEAHTSDTWQLLGLTDLVKSKVATALNIVSQGFMPIPKVEGTWSVLLVEDNVCDGPDLKKRLEEVGVACVWVQTAEAAFTALEKDRLLKDKTRVQSPFVLLITDWRLLKPNGDWQDWQGPDIIDTIISNPATFYNKLDFMVITDKSGAILREIQEKHAVGISWFAKRDVFAASKRDGFLRQVIDQGNQMYKMVQQNQPTRWTTPWTKYVCSLEDYYYFYFNSPNYEALKNQINDCAAYSIVLAQQQQADHFVEMPWDRLRHYPFPMKFLLELNTPPAEASMLRFYPKLVARRIYFGLRQLGWSRQEIASMLFEGRLDWWNSTEFVNKVNKIFEKIDDERRTESEKARIALEEKSKKQSNHDTYLNNYLALPGEDSKPLLEEEVFLSVLTGSSNNHEDKLRTLFSKLYQTLQNHPAIPEKTREERPDLFEPISRADFSKKNRTLLEGFYEMAQTDKAAFEGIFDELARFAHAILSDIHLFFALNRLDDNGKIVNLLFDWEDGLNRVGE